MFCQVVNVANHEHKDGNPMSLPKCVDISKVKLLFYTVSATMAI